MDDRELLEGFQSTALPKEAFGHHEHVRIGWLYVRRYGMPDALRHLREGLKRFAIAKGVPHLYHETITWAYLLVIHERLVRNPVETWDAFAAGNADLLAWKPSVLDRYYTPELLWSDLARASFVMPDRITDE